MSTSKLPSPADDFPAWYVEVMKHAELMAARLASVQRALFADAVAYREANTHEITSFEAFASGVEEQGGFWIGAWGGDGDCEAQISTKTKASTRFLPLQRRDPGAACLHGGKPGSEVATWARAC